MTDCGCDIPKAITPRTGLTPYKGAAPYIAIGGESVIALYGPMVSGFIQNPSTTLAQGIEPLVEGTPVTTMKRIGALNTFGPGRNAPIGIDKIVKHTYEVIDYGPPELLYVSMAGPAALSEIGTTRVLYPGQSMSIPAGWPVNVWVNAVTAGHRFTAIAVQDVTAYPPIAYNGAFPPSGPVTKTTTIPSYIYKEYDDDDDLLEFADAYNEQTQSYVDWFNSINLPIYTGLGGPLLDWVGAGLYGVVRPTLYSGRSKSVGPLNTYGYNAITMNKLKRTSSFTNVAATSDDVYKRIITWNFYKGDGKQVTIRWIKRRILRFLYGENGADFQGGTDQVSVVFGAGGNLAITILTGRRRIVSGAIFNRCAFNTTAYNSSKTALTTLTVPALAAIFKEAIDTGALELPQQYTIACRVGVLGD